MLRWESTHQLVNDGARQSTKTQCIMPCCEYTLKHTATMYTVLLHTWMPSQCKFAVGFFDRGIICISLHLEHLIQATHACHCAYIYTCASKIVKENNKPSQPKSQYLYSSSTCRHTPAPLLALLPAHPHSLFPCCCPSANRDSALRILDNRTCSCLTSVLHF